jgi:hypothetical protein
MFTYVRYTRRTVRRSTTSRGIGRRDARRLRKLDAVKSLPQLQAIGRCRNAIDLESHFAGFSTVRRSVRDAAAAPALQFPVPIRRW